ncbi:PREDICTED: protein LONGIFOLIA 2-like isoform X2 [Ipomoea nil]|uniref:protein LONGIFOLIA 2-like isoform X2 n=1 Tax=Ipomoea nil TaxID=35883 RepID=UPI000901E607|nr:PREDICTED: protein LONGIFOLIA 2-like isoform X2 [Ipomoea nil]
MAAKLLHSLTDDNPDLQKQIGCMTGIFQLFDRQNMLTGGRRMVGHSPKRLISGSPHFNDDTSEKEFSSIYPRPDNQIHKNVQEKQRLSTESSRPSFSSSSRSSSFSSLDCNRTVQPEPMAFDRVIFPETPSRDQAMNQIKTSQYGRQSLDIRDVVKDSMNRESQVKSTLREEVAESITKHRDSPRPLQLSQTFDGSYGPGLYAKQNTPVDLKESLRVLAKLREAPWYYNEPRQLSRSSSYHSKDGSSIAISKDAPRFSYDGKETRHLSFESRDVSKSALKQLPRLSLDSSREASVRPPSVVAKLMGLETLPDSSTPSDSDTRSTKNCRVDDPLPLSRSSEVSDKCKHIQTSSSTRNLWKDPTSPRWRNPDSAMKPASRFPIEPAPWRHFDKTRASEKQTSRNTKTPAKLPNSFPSVYSEIEKRLKDLEFTESGKDLRALKQILEAMQVKGLLETQKVEESKCSGQKEHQQKYASSLQTAKFTHQRTRQSDQATGSTSRGSNSLRHFESPIVIMKPAKLMEESGIPRSSVIPLDGSSCPSKHQGRKGAKDQRVNIINSSDSRTNNRTSKSSQASARSKESTSGSLKTSGSISPRLQQKKLELEKRSRPPTPPSDPNRSRKQANKQPMESNSPGGRRRPKISTTQQNDDQLSENEISVRSNGSVISDSKEDIEVTSSLASFEKNSIQSRMKSVESLISSCIEKRPTSVLPEDGSLAAMVAPEYPSPVSVLDNLVYTDESPLPGKRVPEVLDNGYKDPDRVSSNPSDDLLSNNIGSGITPPEFNRRKLQNIENLVQKLRRLNSSHDEGRTDYIASLCENTNPDHRYVSEILLASGLLLRDIGSSITVFQFHPSGLPINPELFLVLEQTRASTSVKEENIAQFKSKEKVHRKLVFDLVNEILATKLAFLGTFSEPWVKPQKLAKNTLNAQKLLRELCSEIEQLQAKSSKCEVEDEDDELKNILWEDVLHRSGSWTDFNHEISAIVLDVERLVFKDLIGEIVRGEGDNLRNKPSRRRQLFTK